RERTARLCAAATGGFAIPRRGEGRPDAARRPGRDAPALRGTPPLRGAPRASTPRRLRRGCVQRPVLDRLVPLPPREHRLEIAAEAGPLQLLGRHAARERLAGIERPSRGDVVADPE